MGIATVHCLMIFWSSFTYTGLTHCSPVLLIYTPDKVVYSLVSQLPNIVKVKVFKNNTLCEMTMDDFINWFTWLVYNSQTRHRFLMTYLKEDEEDILWKFQAYIISLTWETFKFVSIILKCLIISLQCQIHQVSK